MKEKILVVDDEIQPLKTARILLEQHEYEVVTARGGKEGYQKAVSSLPALILMDLDMPDMDGGTTAQELKENPKTADIPVIFVSGLVLNSDVKKNPRIGDNYCVTKPYNVDYLLKLIRKVLDGEPV
ncbi:MAG: response regulator [bacterium]